MPVVTERELRLTFDDPEHEVDGIRLRGELWKRRSPPEFLRGRDGRWELRLPFPTSVHRIEYQLEVVRADGSQLVRDPTNPLSADGPFGERSVLELPEYEPPAWIDDSSPAGAVRRFSIASQTLRASVRGLLWSAAGTDRRARLPLLVVHDGPEYARYSSLLRFLDAAVGNSELPPMRAALVPPIQRDEHYSASLRYASALARELLPALQKRAPVPEGTHARVGMGASLGAVAMLHAHRTHNGAFGGLFLQSGSFFRRRLDGQERGFARFARIIRFVASVDAEAEWPDLVPIAMTCGMGEENLANNRLARDALAAQGYDVTLYEHPDAHNWVSWRDSFDPPLLSLLQRLWR